jgi:hypothetical protein
MGFLQRVDGRGKTVLNLEELAVYFAERSSLLRVWRICVNFIGFQSLKTNVVGDGPSHGPDWYWVGSGTFRVIGIQVTSC